MTRDCDAFIEVYMLPSYGTYIGGCCALYRFVPVGTTAPSFDREPDYIFNVWLKGVLLGLDHPVRWYIGCLPGSLGHSFYNDSFL